jgi:glycosyltransferase involved in cell wall biosynthesis
MTQPHPTLSLVILCYRSEDSAREFTARTLTMMREHGIESFELILVGNFDEGSSDRTPEVVRELAASDPRIRCRAEPKQGMMGWDLRSGLRDARGAYIAFIDGDGQMPIGDVGRLFKLIENSEFDLVKTHRVTRADGWKRRVLSTGYNIVFRLLFPGLKARDMNAKPKLMRRDAYEKMQLTSDGWFIDAEIMIETLRHKMFIAEIPTEFRRLHRRASFVSLGAVFEFLTNLIRCRFREFFRRP